MFCGGLGLFFFNTTFASLKASKLATSTEICVVMLLVSVNLKKNALRENVTSCYIIDENNDISMMLTCKKRSLDLGLGLILVGSFEKG